MLTAITVLPRLDPDAVYTAQSADANAEGSRVGIVPDATYTVHQLFQGMFLMSGNDAASALANAAGGQRQTVARMNATAKGLGALDTTARNPSGLDAPGQYTSAYDLALFARAGLARQDFRDYVTTVKTEFPGKMPKKGKTRKSFQIYTRIGCCSTTPAPSGSRRAGRRRHAARSSAQPPVTDTPLSRL